MAGSATERRGRSLQAMPATRDNPLGLSRHLVGSFPDRVAKESTTILNVYVALTPEGRSTPLDISVPEGVVGSG